MQGQSVQAAVMHQFILKSAVLKFLGFLIINYIGKKNAVEGSSSVRVLLTVRI